MEYRIGIISYTSSENYGANLQAVALQKKLFDFRIDSEYINFSCTEPLNMRRLIFNKIFNIVRLFFGYRIRKRRTDEFRTKHLNLSPKLSSYEQVKHYCKKYDAIIAGSDQIWNPRILMATQGYYFISFDTTKHKYSYASSFGVSNICDADKKIIKEYLLQFKRIAVRENTASRLLKQINIKSDVVLDPTLLLTKQEWMNYFNIEPIFTQKYILCYVMNGDNESIKYIKKYAKHINKQLGNNNIVLFIGDKEYKRILPNYNLICDAGPVEFLNLIFNASYCITNSFHGTCFSLIFDKPFSVVIKENNKTNSRILDLLGNINATDHIVNLNTPIDKTTANEPKSKATDDAINDLQANSLQYIYNISKELSKDKPTHIKKMHN